jgi:hypothetical protein
MNKEDREKLNLQIYDVWLLAYGHPPDDIGTQL